VEETPAADGEGEEGLLFIVSVLLSIFTAEILE
jgi:hypothetical protein